MCDAICTINSTGNLISHIKYSNCKILNSQLKTEIADGVLSHKCSFCSAKRACGEQIALHIMTSHNDKSLNCSICSESVRICDLKMHKNTHLNETRNISILHCAACNFSGLATQFIKHIAGIHRFALEKQTKHQYQYFSKNTNPKLSVLAIMLQRELIDRS